MYETDLLEPVIHETQELSGAGYGKDDRVDRSLRIVTEHGRSASFLIADGVLPSNEGRGYILRRLLRRSVRHLRMLGVEHPALSRVCARVVDNLGEAWPDDQNVVATCRQRLHARPPELAKPSLDPVPGNGAGDRFLRHRQAEPRRPLVLLACEPVKSQEACRNRPATPVDRVEVPRTREAVAALHLRGEAYAERRLRPRARRRLRIARPPRVAIRARNPCLRFRRRTLG